MSDSVRPHRQQPTRLPRPWDSPGKNTGVGCHFLLQCMKLKSESKVAQSCPTLRDPMDCSPPGSSVHGIFQARVLEWVPLPSPDQSAKAAITKCPRPGGFNHRNLFPTALEPGKSKIKVQSWFHSEVPSLSLLVAAISLCAHMTSSLRV